MKGKILLLNEPSFNLIDFQLIEGLNQCDHTNLYCINNNSGATPQNLIDTNDVSNIKWDFVFVYDQKLVRSKLFRDLNKTTTSVYFAFSDNGRIELKIKEINQFDYVVKNVVFKQKNSLNHYLDILKAREFSVEKAVYSHKWMPFPNYMGMRNRTRLVDVIHNLNYCFMKPNLIRSNWCMHYRYPGGIYTDQHKYSLSCTLNPNTPQRIEVCNFLTKLSEGYDDWLISHRLFDKRSNKKYMKPSFGYEYAHQTYFEVLQKSFCSVAYPGNGYNTQRFYDILWAGSLLINKRVTLDMEYPFVENKHYLAFDSLAELKEKIEFIYSHRIEAEKIRKAGFEFALQHHTSKARAEQLIANLKNS